MVAQDLKIRHVCVAKSNAFGRTPETGRPDIAQQYKPEGGYSREEKTADGAGLGIADTPFPSKHRKK
jgi:hypothetical protein